MPRRPILAATIALTLIAPALRAATIYWDGTGTGWESVLSWSTDPSNTTPDPLTVPNSDDVVFNILGMNAAQTVNLNADQVAGSLTVQTTGAVNVLGGSGDHFLTLHSGMTVAAGGGPLTIGSATAGQNVSISLSGHQTWANNSGPASPSAIHVVNNVFFGLANENTVATLALEGNTPTTVVNTISGSLVEASLGFLSIRVSP